MKTESQNLHILALLGMVFFAIAARVAAPTVFPQYLNFAPIGAMALFCGAYIRGRMRAMIIMLLAVWVGDVFLNSTIYYHTLTFFYGGWYWQYLSYAAIVLLGGLLKNRVNPLPILGASLASSLVFFLISNFGEWAHGVLYPLNAAGLAECFTMGLPFLRNTLLSDLFYSAVLFGAFEFAMKRFPALAKKRLQPAIIGKVESETTKIPMSVLP